MSESRWRDCSVCGRRSFVPAEFRTEANLNRPSGRCRKKIQFQAKQREHEIDAAKKLMRAPRRGLPDV